MQKDLIERKNLFDDWNGQKLKEQKKNRHYKLCFIAQCF